ncbi:MAG: tetratricopeptide repeat protein [Candidatus Tenebribacter burtonii]|nr:tetratricopeptide repeat protein [Candidatus Tenebribacter burtonii]
MNKPIRHNNHILETESTKFFNNHVPNEWFVDKPEHDYGIDFIVNIVSKNNVTGLSFSVQLKSKIKNINSKTISIKLKHSTLGLFNTKLEPVMLIVYNQKDYEAYWYWYNDLNVDLTSTQKTYTFKIPKTNKLSIINWESVSNYVKDTFSIKLLVDGIKDLEFNEISNSQILAWKYYFSKDFEKAIFYFKNLLKETPDDVLVLEGLAQSQYKSFYYKEAIHNINKVIKISGNDNHYLTKACILAEDGIQNNQKGKIIKAKNLFKNFLVKNNKHFIYHYNYANSLSYLGNKQDSIKHFEICLQLNPNFEQAWKNLGSVYFNIGEHEKEINCYDNALKINPKLPQALFSKGITLSRIYNRDKEGLNLMLQVINDNETRLLEYRYGFFEIAHVYKKLDKIKESLSWINRGLDFYSNDVVYLNFKSNLLIENWVDNEWLKDEAVNFFEFRLELDKDYRSLYAILKIKQIVDENTIFSLIKENTLLFNEISLKSIKLCNICLEDSLVFLLHYDRYIVFRDNNPIHRYIDHLISELYIITSEFWDILDLVFAISYSSAIIAYARSKNPDDIANKILDVISLSADCLSILFSDSDFSKEDSISIMSHIYLEFPLLVVREFGTQVGMITGSLGITRINSEDIISEVWFNKLQENTLTVINKKLKLIKEE